MTDEQLAAIEARVERTTPGPWHPIVTDDEVFQGAVYVGLEARGKFAEATGMYVDGTRHKKRLMEGSVDPERVVAITCLQRPDLVYQEACDENAVFIAHAREDVPALLDEVRRLRARPAKGTDDSVEARTLTVSEAFDAMTRFLDEYWRRTNDDGVAALLAGVQRHEDGTTFDSAAWHDWRAAVEADQSREGRSID